MPDEHAKAPAPRDSHERGSAAPACATDGAVERVIFGIDFAPASLGAARWAVAHRDRGALGAPAEACVAHVVPWEGAPSESGPEAEGGHPDLRPLRPALLGGLAGVAASLRLDGARPVLRVGRPSAVLEALVVAERARLLVLGRRRDSARTRIGEPNVIERVARRAPCDVLVVPEGAAGPVEHVVAAVDRSPWAASVVERSLALAHAHGAALSLVHVLAPFHGSYERLVAARRRAPEDRLDEAPGAAAGRDAAYAWLAALVRYADPGIACRLVVADGDPAREICDVAAAGGAPLVVVGKRGADDAPAGSLGSVARELALRGPAPVLAVARGAAPGAR